MSVKYKLWELLPYTARVVIDVKRRKKYWLNSNCIFIHIPKSAGVSISNALYGRALGHFTVSQIKKNIGPEYKKYYKFSVMRDPVERVVSAYKFAVNGSGSLTHKLRGNNTLGRFENVNDFIVNYLQYAPIEELDGIFRPQCDYILDSGHVAVDKVYSIKKLNELESDLRVMYGFDINIGKENVSFGEGSRASVSDTSKMLIKEIYRRDYSLIDQLNIKV